MRKLDSQSILKSRIKFLVEILVSNVNKVVSCYLIAAQKCCFSTHKMVRPILCFLFLTSKLVKNRTHENESSISLGGATNFTRSLFLFVHSNLIWHQYILSRSYQKSF